MLQDEFDGEEYNIKNSIKIQHTKIKKSLNTKGRKMSASEYNKGIAINMDSANIPKENQVTIEEAGGPGHPLAIQE